MLPTRPVAQIAYYVNDVRASARKMREAFGAGPFFVLENIELTLLVVGALIVVAGWIRWRLRREKAMQSLGE